MMNVILIINLYSLIYGHPHPINPLSPDVMQKAQFPTNSSTSLCTKVDFSCHFMVCVFKLHSHRPQTYEEEKKIVRWNGNLWWQAHSIVNNIRAFLNHTTLCSRFIYFSFSKHSLTKLPNVLAKGYEVILNY